MNSQSQIRPGCVCGRGTRRLLVSVKCSVSALLLLTICSEANQADIMMLPPEGTVGWPTRRGGEHSQQPALRGNRKRVVKKRR